MLSEYGLLGVSGAEGRGAVPASIADGPIADLHCRIYQEGPVLTDTELTGLAIA